MIRFRSTALFILAVTCVLCIDVVGQNASPLSSPKLPVRHLNRTNSGQRVDARVGQVIEITMQTIGPGQYESPEISSPKVRFEGWEYAKLQNPGGPKQVYSFRAVAEGESVIKIPHEIKLAPGSDDTKDLTPAFVVTIVVR